MKTQVTQLLYNSVVKVLIPGSIFSRTAGMMLILMFFLYHSANAQELDVPYVSTPHSVVEKMLNVSDVGPDDYVIDLGCGDGRIVVAAAQRGAFGHGIDLDPERIREAEENARQAGVQDKVMFLQQDIFKSDFSRANVITMYLLRSINLKLRPTLLDSLEPGTKIVSHNFDMGEWKPDKRIKIEDNGFLSGSGTGDNSVKESDRDFSKKSGIKNRSITKDTSDFDMGDWMVDNQIKLNNLGIELKGPKLNGPLGIVTRDIYYWVVPAKVEGHWQWQTNEKGFTMTAGQKFQEIDLTIHAGDVELQVEHSGLTGRRIAFTAVNPSTGTKYVYNGRVEGDQITGKVHILDKNKSIENWTARMK
ncbi:MAG: class I SAM-dependent methyltransferase [Bacteroidales bacterium]|nr:class I SAM-dependent methyltransferase [Bacteroidales bacterium]MBS3777519.1 class I SAM-dependent methyltransferase [Bacteroidales bacterium]